jgi:hypothetical protein
MQGVDIWIRKKRTIADRAGDGLEYISILHFNWEEKKLKNVLADRIGDGLDDRVTTPKPIISLGTLAVTSEKKDYGV